MLTKAGERAHWELRAKTLSSAVRCLHFERSMAVFGRDALVELEQRVDLPTALLQRVPHLVADWLELSRHTSWVNVPSSHRVNGIPVLIEAVISFALAPREPAKNADSMDQLIAAAEAHGRARREHRFDLDFLLCEYSLIRQAIWRELHSVPIRVVDQLEAIALVDRTMTLATTISMLAFSEPEIVARGADYPRILAEAIQNCGA